MSMNQSRRAFVRTVAGAALAPAAGELLRARELFAREIERIPDPTSPLPPSQEIRSEYLLDPTVRYLNHASIGTVPRAVHAAGMRYRQICEENPWLYIWGGAWEEAREEVRRAAAALFGCPQECVAITHNTTEGFNLLAQGLPLQPGDEVLFSSLNHPGASICWEYYGERLGYRVRRFEFPLSDVPGLTEAQVIALHEKEIREETRVLVFPHIDNIVGLRHPLKGLVEMARRRGVQFVLVDGAQSAGMIPLALPPTGVDAYSTSPHKWIQSPKGLGLLYVRRELLDLLRPMWVTWGQERWAGTARVYEDYGTRDLPEVLALGDALQFQEALGPARKEARYRGTFEAFRDRVEGGRGLTWRSPRRWEMGGVLMSVGLSGVQADAVSEELYRARRIVVRPFPQTGLNALRVSPNLLNSEAELEELVALLGVRR